MTVTTEELEALLASLRLARSDHQWVEVKRAAGGFPTDLWKSMSAFANTGGGLVVLGVDERRGTFVVTGLSDAAATMRTLQDLCGSATPPLRPVIALVPHLDGNVLVATIPAVPTADRPCFFPQHGDREHAAYWRVGDGDMLMTPAEVRELMTAQAPTDLSRRRAPDGAEVTAAGFDPLYGPSDGVRERTLRRIGLLEEDGSPTLASWLPLGLDAGDISPLARVCAVAAPRPSDPPGALDRATHIKGTVGELLDGTMDWLRGQLTAVQVSRGGAVVDEYDFPLAALREIVANALTHRSFSPDSQTASITVRVTDTVVAVTNPGGLTRGLDARDLGLVAPPAPSNYALVNLCERLTTPAGNRIVESQAVGIARADDACRAAGTAPILFVIEPARFIALAVRGRLDLDGSRRAHPAGTGNDDSARIVAFLERIRVLQTEDPSSLLHRVLLDAALAARLLTHRLPEDATRVLNELADVHVLRAQPRLNVLTWVLASPAWPSTPARLTGDSAASMAKRVGQPAPVKVRRTSKQHIAELLAAVDAAPTGELKPGDTDIGLADRQTRTIFRQALAAELIEPTREAEHDPHRGYRLTALGRRQLNR